MGSMIAPYNNAMRLGQGFNSFTHEICVNDAVVVSPLQAENVLTNDGNTMRLTALITGRPSAWTKQDEVVMDVSYINEAKETRQQILDERSIPEPDVLSDDSDPASPPASDDYEPESDGIDNAGDEDEEMDEASVEEDDLADTQDPDDDAAESIITFGEDPVDEDPEEEPAAEDALSSVQDEGPAGDEAGEESLDEEEESEDPEESEEPGATPALENTSRAADETGDVIEQENSSGDWDAPVSEDWEPPAADEKERPVVDVTQEKVGASAGKKSSSPPKQQAKTPTHTAVEKRTEAEKQKALRELRDKELERINHRKDRKSNMLQAASAFKVNIDLDKMARQHQAYLIPEPTKKAPKVGQQTKVFDIRNSTGVSQTVVFQSRFVEKISEVVNDMGVSAALSVKKGSVGGAGRASFVKTDKFEKNDLNYYISVKVINQSINFKDALEFNKLDNVSDEDFRKVFGDCFISGFLEGGELNALVSMKILNKAKFEDIKAEGSVTLGFDSVDIKADGAFKQAKGNLDLNCETTIQVSWIGGGIIKPPEESWTIDSLTRAASRFPDNVAQSPQRIYALLTKYETLRSYQILKPVAATELDYKSAALYTSDLLDTFTAYRALYNRLSAQIGDVQRGQIKFNAEKRPTLETLSDATRERAVEHLEELTDAQKKALIGVFPATIDGLDDARGAVRDQMNFIVARVDSISKDPAQLSNVKQQQEKFLPIFAFETLLPTLQSVFRNNKRQAPITGEKMYPENDEDGKPHETDTAPSKAYLICPVKIAAPPKQNSTAAGKDKKSADDLPGGLEQTKPLQLRTEEKDSLVKYLSSRDEGIEDQLKLTAPLGSDAVNRPPGKLFTALDFVNPTFLLEYVSVTMKKGVITGLTCDYANGMSWKRGLNDPATPHRMDLDDEERITSVIITVGSEADTPGLESILALRLVTNDGKSLHVEEKQAKRLGVGRRLIAGRPFYDIRSVTFGSPLERGYAIGFWGRSQEIGNPIGIFRLGVVWCNTNAVDEKQVEDAKQNEARDKDAARETQVLDSDNVFREYKELKEEYERLQLEKSLVVKELADEKEKNERDTTDMKTRHEAKLNELDSNHQEKVAQLEADLKQQQAVTATKEKLASERHTILYRLLRDTGRWVLFEHKNGYVLDCHASESRPIFARQHSGWNQRFYFGIAEGFSGFLLFCKDDSGSKTWLGNIDNDEEKALAFGGYTRLLNIDPVGDGSEFFFIRFRTGKVLGPKTESSWDLVEKDQTDLDHWKIIYGQQ